MKLYLKILQRYFQLLSILSPSLAGKKAARLFQKTRRIPIRKKEEALYSLARKFTVFHEEEGIIAYELGDPNGKLVFLLHGWDSNAGSMTGIAKKLAHQGNRVITFDFPAHGKSRLTHTNIYKMSKAFHAVLAQVNPKERFHVVAHSFGSAITIFTLALNNYQADKLILLTSPNKIESHFIQFARQIGLGKKSYSVFTEILGKIARKPVEELVLSDICTEVSYQELLLIHDKHDKVLPIRSSEAFVNLLPNSQLIELGKTGHYRMLWDEKVLEIIGDSLSVADQNAYAI